LVSLSKISYNFQPFRGLRWSQQVGDGGKMASYASFISKTNNIKIWTFGGHRLRMWVLMLIADVISGLLAVFLGHLMVGEWFNFFVFSPGEADHKLSFMFYLLLFISSRLYPGIGINPAEEIKLVVRFSVIVFFATIMMIFILHPNRRDIFITPLFILIFSIVANLLVRWSVRILATQVGIWGEPVVVFARGSQIDHLTSYFLKRRRLGFIPVLAISDLSGRKTVASPVPVIDIRRLLEGGYPIADVDTLLVDASFFGRNLRNNSYNKLTRIFKQVIFVSDMDWLEGASLVVRDLEGLTGIEACRDQLSSTSSIIKRVIDIFGSVFGMLLFAPFLILVIMLIKLDSPGPVFYLQERISMDRRKKKRQGSGTRKICIYKFRSMYVNADQALAEYLAHNEQARLEWDQTQKLHDDPRITRVGKWLRRFSIDEIPQLYNVLKGEMSLVGPRPMMTNQVKPYGQSFESYTGVRPGLTGFWQVSGRNNTTFQERARFDLYYVNNWSIWLDLYILVRTVWVVLSRYGAY
jgi:Undecaprenyl-phosphate galactose phosphotransferase WbaP